MKNLINKLALYESSDEAGRPYVKMQAVDGEDKLVVVGDETGIFKILLNGLMADLSPFELDHVLKNYKRIVEKYVTNDQQLLSLY